MKKPARSRRTLAALPSASKRPQRAEPLRPEHDVGRRRRRNQRRLHDRRLAVGERGQLFTAREGLRSAVRERRHAGVAAIRGLAQPPEQRAAHVAALVHQNAHGRGVHFARQLVERGRKLRCREAIQSGDCRKAKVERCVLRGADGPLVRRQSRQLCDARRQRHQQHVGRRVGEARAQRRRQALGRHSVERAAAPARRGEDRVAVRRIGPGAEDELRGAGERRAARDVGAVGRGRRDLDAIDARRRRAPDCR